MIPQIVWPYLHSFLAQFVSTKMYNYNLKAESPQVIDIPEPELVVSAPGDPDCLEPTQTNTGLITITPFTVTIIITTAEGSRWW